ncbi:MAG: hypothetical protein ACE5JL_15235, partial [Dehalococcoidia bacterium]
PWVKVTPSGEILETGGGTQQRVVGIGESRLALDPQTGQQLYIEIDPKHPEHEAIFQSVLNELGQ